MAFILIMVILLPKESIAQINTDISLLTSQEQQYLSTAKSTYKKYQKLYKHYRKDSAKMHRRIYKETRASAKDSVWLSNPPSPGLRRAREKGDVFMEAKVAHYSDSLKATYNLSAYAEEAETYNQYLKDPESVEWKEFFARSKSELESKFSEVEEYKELKKLESEMKEYTGELSKYTKVLDDPDSALTELKENALSKAEKKVELMKRDEIKELMKQDAALQSMTSLPEETKKLMLAKLGKINPDDLKNLPDNLSDEALASIMEKSKSLADKVFDTHEKKIEEAVAGFNDLKKKYRSIVHNGDEVEYVKKNQFKNASPIQRIFIGGNLKINRKESVTIDFAPQLGYRFMKQLAAGAGLNYRFDFGNESWQFNDTSFVSEMKGWNVFLQHGITKGFFGYIEGEYSNLKKEETTSNSDVPIKTSQWVPAIRAGIGKKYKVSNIINGTVLFLYDFAYDKEKSPFKKPFQVKFGFNLNGNGLKAKQNRKKNIERVEGLLGKR